jgi:hypothetical protein
MQESCGPELFCRRRWYILKYLIGIGVAAALMALCVGWPIHDAVAQTNEGTLTVEECLGDANASVDPIAEVLIKEGIIRENLLSTNVTDGMCEDMLQRAPDGTPVQRLVTAQNYLQEIELIENAIREAAGEAAARGPDRHFPANEPLVLTRSTLLAVTQSAARAQYGGGGGGAPSGGVAAERPTGACS